MGEQKNLFLAIGLSVAIIIVFQLLFPQQSVMSPTSTNDIEEIQPATSIDDNQVVSRTIVKSKEDIIVLSDRVNIQNPLLSGSINLTGAILDDLVLLKYKESLNDDSKNINLFSPEETANPYYIEFGWKKLSNNSSVIDLPMRDTQWSATASNLTPNSPVTLVWTNNQNVTFKIHFEIDDNYLFNVSQIIENNSSSNIEVFPYRLIKRINLPDTINFFILH